MSQAQRVIDLMRHGKVAGKPALYGHTDVALSNDGINQLHASIAQLPKPDQVICSPLQRCRAFAEQITAKPIVIAPLAEMNFGDWDGVPFDDLSEQWPQLSQFWQDPNGCQLPNGESLAQFNQRVLQGWQQVLAHADQRHQLVVCHGGVIRMIIAAVLGVDYRLSQWYSNLTIDYASISRIVIGAHPQAQPQVKFINHCKDPFNVKEPTHA